MDCRFTNGFIWRGYDRGVLILNSRRLAMGMRGSCSCNTCCSSRKPSHNHQDVLDYQTMFGVGLFPEVEHGGRNRNSDWGVVHVFEGGDWEARAMQGEEIGAYPAGVTPYNSRNWDERGGTHFKHGASGYIQRLGNMTTSEIGDIRASRVYQESRVHEFPREKEKSHLKQN
ncbi:hypothetical protein L1887_37525 [Cichorium endivia]|nr:hypothetical protein L1887_37525 [Cichorium endivia]